MSFFFVLIPQTIRHCRTGALQQVIPVVFQIVRTMEGYTNTAAPDEALVGHALRVFGLKCHPEYEHLFVTGGWDNHLKVTGLVTNLFMF